MSNLTTCTFGVKFKDFVLIAACKTRVDGVVVYQDVETARAVSGRLALGVQGTPGDTQRFLEFVAVNTTHYEMRHSFPMSAPVFAHYVRKACADALRTASAFMVSAVLAGYEPDVGPLLYYMSELGSIHKVSSIVGGLAGTLAWAQLDIHCDTEKTEEEGFSILKGCVEQVTERYFINLSTFSVFITDKNGARQLPDICGKTQGSGQGDAGNPQ